MNYLNRYLLFLLMIGVGAPFLLPQMAGAPPSKKEGVSRELDEVARIATALIDGDICKRIMTKRSLDLMFVVNPKDPYSASDDFDVNHEPYISTKKTLIRLSRLVPFDCDVNLWMPFQQKPERIQVLIRNVNEWSQFWTWGKLTQEMPAEMKRVLETGKRETVQRIPGMISVLAPVHDSLGDIVGLVEVVAMEPGVKPPQVHAKLRSDQGTPADSERGLPASGLPVR